MITKGKLALVGMVLMAWPFATQAQLTFTTNDGAITITGYAGSGGSVVIPCATNGLRVNAIGDYAFINATNVTELSIPDSITSIGYLAVSDCTSLTNVIIGSGVTNIGTHAFNSCPVLATMSIDPGNLYYGCVGGALFGKNPMILIKCFEPNSGSYNIPSGTANLKYDAFDSCNLLTNVFIPSSITNFTMPVFIGSDNIQSLTVDPQNPVFCSVNGIVLDTNQTIIIAYPEGRLGAYFVPSTITGIADWAFGYCSLGPVTIGNSVTIIGNFAFFNNYNITSVTIGKNVGSMGEQSFAYCPYLTNVTFVCNIPNYPYTDSAFEDDPISGQLLIQPDINASPNSFGVQTNQFGFGINWASGQEVVVYACTNLAGGVWLPLQTNMLTSSSMYFSDPQWTNYPARYYRILSP